MFTIRLRVPKSAARYTCLPLTIDCRVRFDGHHKLWLWTSVLLWVDRIWTCLSDATDTGCMVIHNKNTYFCSKALCLTSCRSSSPLTARLGIRACGTDALKKMCCWCCCDVGRSLDEKNPFVALGIGCQQLVQGALIGPKTDVECPYYGWTSKNRLREAFFFCLVFLFLLVHCPSSAWSVPKPDFHYSICVDPSGALVVSIWLWISKVADSCTGRNQRRGMIAITFTTPLVRLFHFHQITPICLPTC